MEHSFDGRVAVITGAGGVLCSVMAKALAEAGARVALLGRTAEKVQRVADEITAVGGTARAYVCDVCDRDSVKDCHRRVLEQLGQCDLLINGAGGNKPQATTEHEYYEAGDLDAPVRSFFDLRPEDIESVLQLNFSGTLIPTQVFAQDMLGRGGCSILNISSMNAYTPLTKIPAYSGAKAPYPTLHSGWQFTLLSRESASMPSHRAFCLRSRTRHCCGMKTAPRRLVPARY